MSAYARAQRWPNHHPMRGSRRGNRRPWMGPPGMHSPSPWYWDGQEDMEPQRCWPMEHPNMRPHHPPHHCCHRGRYDDCCYVYDEDLPAYYGDFENEKSPFEYFKDFCGEKINEREGPNSCDEQSFQSFDFGDLSKMLTSLMKQQQLAEQQKQRPQFHRSRSKLESGAAKTLPSKRPNWKKQMSRDLSASKGEGGKEFVVMKTPYGDLYLKPNPSCSKKTAPNFRTKSSANKMSDPTRPLKSVGRQASRDSGEGWKMVDTKFGPVMVKYISGDTNENNEDRKTDYECPPNRKRKINEEMKRQPEHIPIDIHHTLTDTTTEKPLFENSFKKESADKNSKRKADAKESKREHDGFKLIDTALGPMLVMNCKEQATKTEDDKLPDDDKKMDSNGYKVVNTILGPMLVKVDDEKEIKHENEKQEMSKPTSPKKVNCNIPIQTNKQENSGNKSMIDRDPKSEVEKTSAQEKSNLAEHSKHANANGSNMKVIETPYGPVVVIGNSDDSEKIENDTKSEHDPWKVINTMFGPMLVKQVRDDKKQEKQVQKAQENKKNLSCEIPIDITKTKKDGKIEKDKTEDNKREGSGENLQDHQPSKSKTANNMMNSQQELKHESEETLTKDFENDVHKIQESNDVPEITVVTSEERNESESLQKFKTEEALDKIDVDDISTDEGFEERDGLSNVSMEVQVNDDLDVSSLFIEEKDDCYPQVPSLIELATAQMSQEIFDHVNSKKIQNERDSAMNDVQEDKNSNAENEKIINQKQDTIRNDNIEKTDCSEEIAASIKDNNSKPSPVEPKKKCDVPTKEQLHVKGVVSYNADHSEWSVTFNLQHFAQDSISVRVVSHDIVVEAERLLPSGEVYSLVKDIPIPTNYDPDTVACFMDDAGHLRVKADRRKIKDHRYIPISGRD